MRQFWGFVAGFIFLSSCALSAAQDQDLNYGLYIDAGSSGSRIYVYNWPTRHDNHIAGVAVPVGQSGSYWNQKITPGISAYASNVSGVVAALSPLVDFAVTRVPDDKQASTPIYLRATAGMRLLDVTAAEQIYGAIRDYFSDKTRVPFLFKREWVSTLSGEDEGVYGWVTTNYLLQRLAPIQANYTFPNNTAVALDLGGASTQITFSPKEMPLSNHYKLTIDDDVNYNLYTFSYLHYGVDQALERYQSYLFSTPGYLVNNTLSDPCFISGYSNPSFAHNGTTYTYAGAGDKDRCTAAVLASLFPAGVYCIAEPCAINGVYQPSVDANLDVYMFSAFYFATNFTVPFFTNQPFPTTMTPQLIDQANQHYLTASFADFQAYCKKVSPYKPELFGWQGVYIYNILTVGYKLSDTRVLHAVGDINGKDAGWTLGAMLYDAGLFPFQMPSTADSYKSSFIVMTMLSLFLFVGLAIVVVLWYRERKHRNKAEEYSNVTASLL